MSRQALRTSGYVPTRNQLRPRKSTGNCCQSWRLTSDQWLNADAMLAQRGEVAISSEELHELRALAASGADSAELAQETADLIALLHQARSSNATVSLLRSGAVHLFFIKGCLLENCTKARNYFWEASRSDADACTLLCQQAVLPVQTTD